MYKSFIKLSLGLVMLTSSSAMLYSCKDKKKPEVVEPAPVPTEPARVEPTAPVVITADDSLRNNIVDATKDFPKVAATVDNGVITLKGEIERAKLKTLIQALNNLHPKKINNELVIK